MNNNRFCSHLCVFGQDRWLDKHISMIGQYVEKVYLSYSDIPWDYNKMARQQFKNSFNPDSLKDHKYYDKIEFIKGTWDLDEQQRNSCLDAAKRDGFDYMFIIDCDEFYKYDDIQKMIDNINNNPDYEYYTTPWLSFWKDYQHIVINENNDPIIGYPEVCINLHKDQRFIRCRRPSGTKNYQLDSLCYHMSNVLTDQECWTKINTWGHSHQFSVGQWFQEKWLNWNENTLDLHPVNPPVWKQAVKHNYELPEILK